MKKRIALIVVLLFSVSCALSETFSGKTAFLKTQSAYADFEGTVEQVFLTEGAEISAGEAMLSLKSECIYADFDATIRGMYAVEGAFLSGQAFALEPKEKYRLLGSTSYAYDGNTLVHPGETVYIACVADATHLAVGCIAQVDGEEFTVHTTHGTLYLGEAVNVYNSPERNYQTRIGRATVYASENSAVEIEGMPLKIYVQEGDRVEKGEILMKYLPGDNESETLLQYAKTGGIVTNVLVHAGDRVQAGDKLFEYALPLEIGVSVQVAQADMAAIELGSKAEIILGIDPEETPYPAQVCSIRPLSDAMYEVFLSTDGSMPVLRAGLTAQVDGWK